MKLAPHMIQSMEILQMPMAALEERIEQELESNATLELTEGEAPPIEPGSGTPLSENGTEGEGRLELDATSGQDDFARLDSYEHTNPEAAANQFEENRTHERDDYFEHARPSGDMDRDAKSEAMANTPDRRQSPMEQLREDWSLSEVDAALRPLGEAIIGFIEDDGYVRVPLTTIIEKMPPLDGGTRPTLEHMERALRAVQLLLEPPGLGARDMKECLLLQIDAKEAGFDGQNAWEVPRQIVESHLDDLANNRFPKIAQKLGVGVDDVKAAVLKLRTLSLAPGRQLIDTAETPITPDAFVEYDAENDRYFAYLNDSRLPNLQVNKEYARMARDKAVPKPTKDFIRTNLSNAMFLIDAIEQRKRTILRVIEVVVAAQREFFDYGPQSIKPLPMTKVAEQLGIHVATVSRAVAEKYLQTPRGIVALRKFFTGGTLTDEGEEVSWDAIKAALSEIIEKEDKHNPLSDDHLADALKERGLEIARRTVAKYRGQLGIPTGRLRKAY
ncbi:MAG: RNA polymerase factor sigma-54 [Phycisphaerales bacterium]